MGLQVVMNFNAMMENMAMQAMENEEIFQTRSPQNFVSARTPEGDILVMKAHQATREVMKEVCPHLFVGLSLSLHDIQPVNGGEAAAEKEWEEEFEKAGKKSMPILISENGIATSDDSRRIAFIDIVENARV